jgi:hypothetical protein
MPDTFDMFQPRFAPVDTASFRQRLKIDAVDTWRFLLIIRTDATRFIGLSLSAECEPQAGRIKKQ